MSRGIHFTGAYNTGAAIQLNMLFTSTSKRLLYATSQRYMEMMLINMNGNCLLKKYPGIDLLGWKYQMSIVNPQIAKHSGTSPWDRLRIVGTVSVFKSASNRHQEGTTLNNGFLGWGVFYCPRSSSNTTYWAPFTNKMVGCLIPD